jgi:hypothetical protein
MLLIWRMVMANRQLKRISREWSRLAACTANDTIIKEHLTFEAYQRNQWRLQLRMSPSFVNRTIDI